MFRCLSKVGRVEIVDEALCSRPRRQPDFNLSPPATHTEGRTADDFLPSFGSTSKLDDLLLHGAVKRRTKRPSFVLKRRRNEPQEDAAAFGGGFVGLETATTNETVGP